MDDVTPQDAVDLAYFEVPPHHLLDNLSLAKAGRTIRPEWSDSVENLHRPQGAPQALRWTGRSHATRTKKG
jgi:hypothetical protein